MPTKTSPKAKAPVSEEEGLDREVAKRLLRKRRVVTQRVSFVLDESGSMQSVKSATLDGFNEYLATLQREAVATFTLTAFYTAVRVVRESKAVTEVEPLTDKTYLPGGGQVRLVG